MRDPEAWADALPERSRRLWEAYDAETPIGPGDLIHMLARLCATVNWSGPRPLDQGEGFWMLGRRHRQED